MEGDGTMSEKGEGKKTVRVTADIYCLLELTVAHSQCWGARELLCVSQKKQPVTQRQQILRSLGLIVPDGQHPKQN